MPYIKRIKIHSLRNLTDISLDFSPSVNIFFGNNGSGKSSLLESIAFLGLGKSFRTHKPKMVIQHNCEKLTVFGELNCQLNQLTHLGIQKDKRGQTNLKINGANVYSSSLLAKKLPLQIINSHSLQLLEGSSKQRRQFLDWMVFHVKPDFINTWISLQKVIKQRNSLLRRDKISETELLSWDNELVNLSEILHELRNEVFNEFKETLAQPTSEIITQHDAIEFEYYRGWNHEKSLRQVLKETLRKDIHSGYTHHGPHRADLKISINGRSITDLLSRGQEKSLVCRLYIGQSTYYQSKLNENCVFLIDDMLSELDMDHRNHLANWLFDMKSQIFVTGVDKKELLNVWHTIDTDIAVFHVKHDAITKVT